MIMAEYDIQYTTQKAIKWSILVDNLAHQAVDDYKSMNFEFPDENIMLVTDCEEPGPNEGPEKGSWWTMAFDGASNALGNGIGAVIIFLEGLDNFCLGKSDSVIEGLWSFCLFLFCQSTQHATMAHFFEGNKWMKP